MMVTTAMGWPLRVTAKTKPRSLKNHPVQSCGADVLRLAVPALVANDIRVCAPIHDAVLVECRIGEVAACTTEVKRIMREASFAVLGHPIPVDCKVTTHPDHYVDGRGIEMYGTVMDLLAQIEADAAKNGGYRGVSAERSAELR